ncbi:hypothetical protein IJ556_05330, partial [bacterium]|nr:hypothetical protein [bacterium]
HTFASAVETENTSPKKANTHILRIAVRPKIKFSTGKNNPKNIHRQGFSYIIISRILVFLCECFIKILKIV